MGLFDSFRSSITTEFTVPQAIMTIVIAALKADGDISQEEITRIRAMCVLSPIFSRNSGDEDSALVGFADDVTRRLSSDAISRAAAALKPELRETAFAFACDMVLADGLVGPREERFIQSLLATLELSEDLGTAIVQTTLIRNRGAR